MTNGTLVNAPGGTIRALPGAAAGGSRTLDAQLDNQGLLSVLTPLTISRTSADHLNSGTIDVSAANLLLTQGGATPGFTNTGTITIGAGRTFTVNSGTFTGDPGGTITGGTLTLTNVTAAFNGAAPAVSALNLSSTNATFAAPLSSSTVGYSFTNTTINGAGPFTNAVGQTLTLVASTINMPVDNQGTLIVSGNSTITGALTTNAGSVLRVGQVDGTTSVANLTVANGFTNLGAIELTVVFGAAYNAQLTVTNGILVNASGGTISALPGAAAGGSRTLDAQLDNQGILTMLTPLAMNRVGADHVNSGTIDVSAANLTLLQSGTTPSFTNTGTITIGAGRTFTVNSGTFTGDPGGTIGGGTLTLTNLTAVFNGAAPAVSAFNLSGTNATFAAPLNTSAVTYGFTNTTINGAGPFTNAAGQTLTLVGSTINMPVDNQGTIIASGNTAINGALTTTAGSILRIGQVDGSTSQATLTVANGFSNLGAIELTVIFGAAYNAQLTVTSGTLTNAAGGTISALPGAAAGGARIIAAQLDNQGTVTVNTPLTINAPSADHLNSGLIDLVGGNVALAQTGVTPSFTNTAAISIGSGRTFAVSSGTFTSQPGAPIAGGTLALTNATAAFNGATPNVDAFSLSSVTATFAGILGTATTAFSIANSTLNGSSTFTNAAGQTLTLTGISALNLPVDNQGTLVASGTSTISGALTTNAGSVLRVGMVDGSSSQATLTVTSGFTNLGAIELTVVFAAGYSARLTVGGTLTNAAGGTITTLNGAAGGGTRVIEAAVNNQGTITVGPGTAGRLEITGSLTTTGTINLELGGTTADTQYDRIVVSGGVPGPGSVSLGGTLNVILINAFTPAPTNTFAVISAASLLGTFVTPNLPLGIAALPTYGPTGVTLIAP